MEKIKLNSGKLLDLIVNGISSDTKNITIKFLPGDDSLDTLNTLMISKDETKKMMLLSESGDELAVYNGYTELKSIGQEMNAVVGYSQENQEPITGKLVTVVLGKPDEIATRMAAVESQLTDTQLALCEIYEGMV